MVPEGMNSAASLPVNFAMCASRTLVHGSSYTSSPNEACTAYAYISWVGTVLDTLRRRLSIVDYDANLLSYRLTEGVSKSNKLRGRGFIHR